MRGPIAHAAHRSGSTSAPPNPPAVACGIEGLEPRLLLATFVVTNTTDVGGTGTIASRSLRQAINAANSNNNDGTTIDRIEFNIPGAGVKTITPASALPTITDAVVIDGSTQPGFDGVPLIELNGTNAGNGAWGVRITAGRSAVRALAINRFGGAFGGGGISLEDGGGNLVAGCRIGTDPTGTIGRGNAGHGVSITVPFKPRPSVVGGTTLADLNVISGNAGDGVYIEGSLGNHIRGNHIGVNTQGTAAIPNGGSGVYVVDGQETAIGGTAAGSRNVISANRGTGVTVFNGPGDYDGDNWVQGNFIGTDASGLFGLGNGSFGVVINGSRNNDVGGTTAATRNVISGNASAGVLLAAGAGGNSVAGNYIGTDVHGDDAIPNGNGGVQVNMAGFNIIGGRNDAFGRAGNLISGNTGHGVFIARPGADGNEVGGNVIGLKVNGSDRLGNSLSGVAISDGSDNTVGGAAASSRNVISGNGGHGVLLQDGSDAGASGSDDNFVRGNFIGTDTLGVRDRGNGGDGVSVGAFCDNNRIDAGNVIAFNNGDGVMVAGPANAGAGNTVSANSIFANDERGIDLHDDGTTRNDANDPDAGANGLQNYPLMSAVTSQTSGTRIVGSLNTNAASGQHRIEFFASAAPDPSGLGEGQTFLGATTVTLATGNTVNFDVLVAAVPPGQYVTATATRVSTGSTSEFSLADVAADRIPPRIEVAEFRYQAGPQALIYRFSENVSASLSATDLTLENLTTGGTVSAASMAVSYDAVFTNTAFITFPGLPGGILPDGNYRATLSSAGVTDAAGNPMAADHVLRFFFLQGDINHDRVVDVADLGILSSRYGLASGVRFTDGDLNYDAVVDVVDLGLLASQYGKALPL